MRTKNRENGHRSGLRRQMSGGGGQRERNEAGRVARNQSLMGLECHAEFIGFYSEGTGDPWKS